jgi:hypothetical protein
MAFSTIANSATYQFTTQSVNHNVPGLTPSAGQLILIFFAVDGGNVTVTTPADFTLLAEDDVAANNTGASGRLIVYGKIATGSEGTTNVNIVTSASRSGAATQFIVSDWYGHLTDGLAFSSTTIPNASDPASVSPPWGSADNLFIAFAAIFDDDLNYTAAPTNYGNLTNVVSGNVNPAEGCGLGTARRQLAAASDDPGTFTVDVGSGTFEFCGTMAIRPSGGSSTTAQPDKATLTLSGRTPTTSSFTNVRIREVLINGSGQAVSNATDITLCVWYAGRIGGAPDVSINGQTTDPNGTTSWSIATGSLAFNQTIFYVAQNSLSYSHYAAGRIVPSYE